ncbi:MAG: hypothetical protein HQK53_13805 [Oligoflexia bacterium]|nr:hypothetical protein [Oligoflexia bacterium]
MNRCKQSSYNFCSIIDFEDSFTYNLAGEIYRRGVPVEVVSLSNAEAFLQQLATEKMSQSRRVLLYGPGPGHPDDYEYLYPAIRAVLGSSDILHFGVCLGHQLLWRVIAGYPVRPSRRPLHGQAVSFVIPSWLDIFLPEQVGMRELVQRYNSLVLEVPAEVSVERRNNFAFADGECIAGRWDRGVTYQFHPESVGTAHPQVFLGVIERYLYNYSSDWHSNDK